MPGTELVTDEALVWTRRTHFYHCAENKITWNSFRNNFIIASLANMTNAYVIPEDALTKSYSAVHVMTKGDIDPKKKCHQEVEMARPLPLPLKFLPLKQG